jgi:hypothetical protein
LQDFPISADNLIMTALKKITASLTIIVCALLFLPSFNSVEKAADVPAVTVEQAAEAPQALAAAEPGKPEVADGTGGEEIPAPPPASILLDSDILAFYGHPVAKYMGILGRHPKDELLAKLSALADEYRAESGGRGIVMAFYIIYGTVQKHGNIFTMSQINEPLLIEWIEYARERGVLIFLDHQIGKYDPVESLATMFPYLKYPNVHLALDPEWRTTKPMEEFGYVTADEINRAQQTMEKYMIENNIEGERMLVIHQFREVMIRNRADVKADFERVRLVHCMDGVGTPAEKLDTYKFNALAKNMPVKAFKLFYDFKLPGVLVDRPLLTPKEVYALDPRPVVIMYQ